MSEMLEAMKSQLNQPITQGPSPLANWLQGVPRRIEMGALTIEYTVRDEMTNPAAILHGGAVAAMLDDAIGITIFTYGEMHFYTTINLAIDYLASAPAGAVVTVQTQVIRKGRTVINAEATMRDAGGKMLARCTTNLMKIGAVVQSAGKE
jgi:acyl-coenzyme A thioesterase 13